jgi:hypothetical protein
MDVGKAVKLIIIALGGLAGASVLILALTVALLADSGNVPSAGYDHADAVPIRDLRGSP